MSTAITGTPAAPIFFETAGELRGWFARHHADERELHAGFYKKGSGRLSISWPESVDEALCVGWIDGVRRSLGAESYTIRFTPRRAASIWSAVNIGRVGVLSAGGRMLPAGMLAFQARSEKRSRIYTYEQVDNRERWAAQAVQFDEPYAGEFRRHAQAWAFFQRQAPSLRKKWIHWVTNAKADATRQRRLEKLVAACGVGKAL